MKSSWTVLKKSCALADRASHNTIFTISNGYWALNGIMLEDRGDILPTTIVNGVFDVCSMFQLLPPAKEERKYLEPDFFADAGPSPSVANLPSPLLVQFFIDGNELNLERGRITRFRQELDMRNAVYAYSFIHTAPDGRRTRIAMQRFCDAIHIHRAYMRYAVCPLNYSGLVRMASGIDGSVVSNVVKDRQFDVTGMKAPAADTLFLTAKTRARNITVSLAVHNAVAVINYDFEQVVEPGKPVPVEKARNRRLRITEHTVCEAKRVMGQYETELKAGQSLVLEKVMLMATSEDKRCGCALSLDNELKEARKDGFSGAYRQHSSCWHQLWQRSDVVIDGDLPAQRYLRFCLYHILAAAPRHTDQLSVPVKLLTGEYYQGSTFYDTDTYIVPVYTFTHPEWARHCLNWRYIGLEPGRRIAAGLGYKGAKLAWQAGPYGEECLGKWWRFVYSNIHINADVVYALMQYYDATGDSAFLLSRGVELMIESARFYTSRAVYEAGNDCYHLDGVAGPDEGHCTSTDNFYTNYLVKQVLLTAIEMVLSVKAEFPEAFSAIRKKCRLSTTELKQWHAVAQKLRFLFDPETGVYEQYDGFYQLEPAGDDFFARRRDRKEWFAPVRPYQAIHQPDVVMAIILFRQHFPDTVAQANQEFYYPRTMNFSSMSYALNAIMCADCGDVPEAYKNFIICAGMDIDEELTGRHDTAAGIHGTSCGGAWMAAVFGFAGIRLFDGCLFIAPRLPAQWKSLACTLMLHGEEFSFRITPTYVSITGNTLSDVTIPACIAGRDVIIKSGDKVRVRY